MVNWLRRLFGHKWKHLKSYMQPRFRHCFHGLRDVRPDGWMPQSPFSSFRFHIISNKAITCSLFIVTWIGNAQNLHKIRPTDIRMVYPYTIHIFVVTHSQCHVKIYEKNCSGWDYLSWQEWMLSPSLSVDSLALSAARNLKINLNTRKPTIRIWFHRTCLHRCCSCCESLFLFFILIDACVNFKGKISTKWKSKTKMEETKNTRQHRMV